MRADARCGRHMAYDTRATWASWPKWRECGTELHVVGVSWRECSIRNRHLHLIRVPLQLRRIHGVSAGWQGAELAGDFGAEAIADAVFAAGQGADEEADAVVAQLHVGAQV